MQEKITVKTSKNNYDVVIGRDLNPGEWLLDIKRVCHVLIVSDDTVFFLYGKEITQSLTEAGYTVDCFVFEHGEKSKNIHTAEDILEYCASKELTRADLLVALGGGVVGDITGFCASVYLRGIDFAQIPTTLLAAVDSSVGGKTAIDLKAGKNLAGAFYQPIGVLLDVNVFKTLPKEHFAEGMAEAVKYGMIKSRDLFEYFEGNEYDMVKICCECVKIKAYVVGEDEFDTGLRQILNFGHTPAHAIEKLSGYEISHGYAVAIGMVMMTKISEVLGKIPEGSTERLKAVLKKEGLPTECEYSAERLAANSVNDKKRKGNDINLVLLSNIGDACLEKVPVSELEKYYLMGK